MAASSFATAARIDSPSGGLYMHRPNGNHPPHLAGIRRARTQRGQGSFLYDVDMDTHKGKSVDMQELTRRLPSPSSHYFLLDVAHLAGRSIDERKGDAASFCSCLQHIQDGLQGRIANAKCNIAKLLANSIIYRYIYSKDLLEDVLGGRDILTAFRGYNEKEYLEVKVREYPEYFYTYFT